MSDLIAKLNKITHGNLCDPMVVRMDDWNDALSEVQCALEQLTAAQSENEALRARVAELEFESLQVVANKGCGELPQGWVINICMENGASWVEVINPSGYTIDIDRVDLSLTEQVSEALSLADEAEKAGGGDA